MKKETYEAKFAKTIIHDDNTVGEAKAAQKTANELRRFWKKEVLRYIRENEGVDLSVDAQRQISWNIDWTFNLKPSGSVKLTATPMRTFENSGFNAKHVFSVPKRKILK